MSIAPKQPPNKGKSKLLSQLVRLFRLPQSQLQSGSKSPTIGNGLKICTVVLFGTVVSSIACAKIDVEDTSTGGLAPEKPITWYLIDTPYNSKSTRLSVPLQGYDNKATNSLRYYVPTLNDRVYTNKMIHKCHQENKKYGGMVGAFFALAHNPDPYKFNVNGTKPVQIDNVQAPVVSSSSRSYSHQFISSLQETPYRFQQPNRQSIGFPLVFASVHLEEYLLNNIDRSTGYNKQRQLMMRVHNGGYAANDLKTNAKLKSANRNDKKRVSTVMQVEEQHTQFASHKLTNYPQYKQQNEEKRNKSNSVKIVRNESGAKAANVALQSSLYVACQDK